MMLNISSDLTFDSPFSRDSNDIKIFQKVFHLVYENRFEFFDFGLISNKFGESV